MPSFAASRSTTSYARGNCSRVTGCRRDIFSAILSEKKYAVKFIATEMTNARIRPFWPPKRPRTASRTSIRVTSKSVDLKVFMVYQPVQRPAVCCAGTPNQHTQSAIRRGRSGFDAAEGPAQNNVKRCLMFRVLCGGQFTQDAIALEFIEFILQGRQQRTLRWSSNRERRLMFRVLCGGQFTQDAIALEFKEFILQRRQQRTLRWGSNRERRLMFRVLCGGQFTQDAIALEFKEFILQR